MIFGDAPAFDESATLEDIAALWRAGETGAASVGGDAAARRVRSLLAEAASARASDIVFEQGRDACKVFVTAIPWRAAEARASRGAERPAAMGPARSPDGRCIGRAPCPKRRRVRGSAPIRSPSPAQDAGCGVHPASGSRCGSRRRAAGHRAGHRSTIFPIISCYRPNIQHGAG